MRDPDSEGQQITPEQGWTSIHATLDRSRNAMYVAGWPNIMLLWGAIVAGGTFPCTPSKHWRLCLPPTIHGIPAPCGSAWEFQA